MGFFSFLKSMFSVSADTDIAIKYNGFSIVPTPIREGGQFRVAATITKGEGDTLQTHKFIRSDLVGSQSECAEVTIRKAKMTIDQLEDRLFR
ncbi:MAG: HlyU family transcriptional regulator [Psychromonas sp.]